MSDTVFPMAPTPLLPIDGLGAKYPVRRVFCVGRNYEAHAREMGFEPDRKAPFYFNKSAQSVVLSGATIPYPPQTKDFHHEMELVVALHKPAFQVSVQDASTSIYAYGCGLDMTRRDLQIAYREKQRPWSLGKDFENAAVLSTLTRAEYFPLTGAEKIHLHVNGEQRQASTLSMLIWSVPELISDLSRFYQLGAGDLLFTGTPDGVGPVTSGDHLLGGIEGLHDIELTIADPL